METALELIRVPTKLIQVTGAGHELMTSRNRQEVAGQVVPAFLSFAGSMNSMASPSANALS
jgi:hypothetical protein